MGKEIKFVPYTASAPVKVGDKTTWTLQRGESKITVIVFDAAHSKKGASSNDGIQIIGNSKEFKMSEVLGVVAGDKGIKKDRSSRNDIGTTDFTREFGEDGQVTNIFIDPTKQNNIGALASAVAFDLTEDAPAADPNAATGTSPDGTPSTEGSPAVSGSSEQPAPAPEPEAPKAKSVTDPISFGSITSPNFGAYVNQAQFTGFAQGNLAGRTVVNSMNAPQEDALLASAIGDLLKAASFVPSYGSPSGTSDTTGATGSTPAADAGKEADKVEEEAATDEEPKLTVGNPPAVTTTTSTSEADKKKLSEDRKKELDVILNAAFEALNGKEKGFFASIFGSTMDKNKMNQAITKLTGNGGKDLLDAIKAWEDSPYAKNVDQKFQSKTLLEALAGKIAESTDSDPKAQYNEFLKPIIEILAKQSNSLESTQITHILDNKVNEYDAGDFDQHQKMLKENLAKLVEIANKAQETKKAEEAKKAAEDQAKRDQQAEEARHAAELQQAEASRQTTARRSSSRHSH